MAGGGKRGWVLLGGEVEEEKGESREFGGGVGGV